MRIIVYRDLKHDGMHGYQLQSLKANVVVVEQVLPGKFGYPDLYIRHLYFDLNDTPILIVSQTEYELDDAKRSEIVDSAKKLIGGS